MKRFFLLMAATALIMLCPLPFLEGAHAQTTVVGTDVTVGSDSDAVSDANASNEGVSTEFNQNFEAPDVEAEAPATTVLTGNTTAPCVNAVALAASAPGTGAGISLPFRNRRCEREAQSRLMAELGALDIALELQCRNDREIRRIVEEQNLTCRQFAQARAQATVR